MSVPNITVNSVRFNNTSNFRLVADLNNNVLFNSEMFVARVWVIVAVSEHLSVSVSNRFICNRVSRRVLVAVVRRSVRQCGVPHDFGRSCRQFR